MFLARGLTLLETGFFWLCLQVGPPSLSHSCLTASLLASQGLLLFPLNLALLTRCDQWDMGFVMSGACSPVSHSGPSANQEKRSQLDFSCDEEGRGEGRPSSWQPSPRRKSEWGHLRVLKGALLELWADKPGAFRPLCFGLKAKVLWSALLCSISPWKKSGHICRLFTMKDERKKIFSNVRC